MCTNVLSQWQTSNSLVGEKNFKKGLGPPWSPLGPPLAMDLIQWKNLEGR